MSGIFRSILPCDAEKLPVAPFTDFLFEKLRNNLPRVAKKPWLFDISSGKNVLYGDVESKARKVASALSRRGFKQGDALHFVSFDIVDLNVLQLAVWMLGGFTRGSFQQDSSESIAQQMMELVKCKFVAVDSDTVSAVRGAISLSDHALGNCGVINVGDSLVEGAIKFSELTNDDGTAFPSEVKIDPKEDIILICNTSGTTGNPKGVIHTHYSLMSVLSCLVGLVTAADDETNLMTTSNFAISNPWNSSGQMILGNTLYCMSRYKKEEFVQNLLKIKPSHLFLYPYIAAWLARCSELSELDFTFVKKVVLGGSVTDPTTLCLLQKSFPGAYINPTYASTECIGVSSGFNSEKFSAPLCSKTPDGDTMVTSGFLYPPVKAKVLQMESNEMLGRNEVGRLFVQSPFLMKGYLKIDGKPDRSDIDEEGWFNTGDIAFFDESGQLFVRERASSIFKYYMQFVNPSEIESVLQEHPSVLMSCVIGIPNEETTNLAKALVVLKEGKTATEEELLQLVATKMPELKQLHGGLLFVESLPENKGKKVDREAILKIYGKCA